MEIKDGITSEIRYEHDGLGRRIEEGDAHQYFNAQWQVLEERNGDDETVVSYAWSPVYIDALISRDRDTNDDGSLDERLYFLQDANFNVTAVAGMLPKNSTTCYESLYGPNGPGDSR